MTRDFRLRLGFVLLPVLLPACGDGGLEPTTPSAGPALALGGNHACRADTLDTVCWGRGTEGQLGIGATPADARPVAGAPALVSLAAGQRHTCGLDADGLAWCWGDDRDGQLGLGAPAGESCGALPCANTPRPVAGGLRFRAIAAGARSTCALDADGAAFCWGSNDLGQLGTTADSATCTDGRCSRSPIAVAGAPAFTTITAGTGHACGLDRSGKAWCWGFQTGTENQEHIISFFQPEVVAVEGGLSFTRIDAGGLHTCALSAARAAYCWGIDALGAGPTPLESSVPVAVAGGHRFREITSGGFTSCALDEDGAAWCWGPNTSGEIGTEPVGSSVRFDVPTAVTGGFRFESLAGGSATYCGVVVAGETACWGSGESGELGSGHENRTTPVAVPGL